MKKQASEDPIVGTWKFRFNRKTKTLECTSGVNNPDWEIYRGMITEVLGHILNQSVEIDVIEVQSSSYPAAEVLAATKKLIAEQSGRDIPVIVKTKSTPQPSVKEEPQQEIGTTPIQKQINIQGN